MFCLYVTLREVWRSALTCVISNVVFGMCTYTIKVVILFIFLLYFNGVPVYCIWNLWFRNDLDSLFVTLTRDTAMWEGRGHPAACPPCVIEG